MGGLIIVADLLFSRLWPELIKKIEQIIASLNFHFTASDFCLSR